MLRKYLASRTFSSIRLKSQRGSIIVPAAFAILVGIVLLGSAQLGYVFYMKRELQNSADLAALSSVQVLNAISPARCPEATAAAITAGEANMVAIAGPLVSSNFTTLECTRWDPTHWQNPTTVDPTGRYIYAPGAGESYNAMHIQLQKSVPYIFPVVGGSSGATLVNAEAVATTLMPTAAFSVGSQLLRMGSPSPLTNILQLAGLPVNATLVDYRGLANVSITPSGLLAALGLNPDVDLTVGSTGALVAARQVSVGQLLTATASIASNQGNSVAAAQITALNSLLATTLNVNNLNINLFGTTAGSGLFGMITSGTRDAALNAQVDALGLISTTIGIATANHAVSLSLSALGIPVSVGLIEPPSIGIGGVGTTAYNAQVRLFIDISINSPLNPTPSPLAGLVPLFQLLGISLNLPIAIDLIDGYGTLKSIDCSQAVRNAKIEVTSTLMHVCIGNITQATAFSTTDPCSANGPPDISFLTVLGIVAPATHINLAGLTTTTSPPLSFNVSAATPLPQTQSTSPNPLALGNTVAAVGDALMGVVDGLLSPSSSGASASDASVALSLATQYLKKTINTTTGKYDVAAVVPLLQNGSASLGLAPLGTWTVPKGVPTPCGLLNISTCAVDGSVWTGFTDSVTGAGQGTLGQILGGLLGGLVLNNCSGLVGSLLTYNPCVANNLASYLQTSPTGLAAPTASGAAGQTCGLLCTLLSPIVNNTLAPLLNATGSLLSSVLNNVLGIQLGETDVTLSGLTCAKPRLVY